jgi:23S rRNA (cytidine1920-2'-O)/16S rRNA (cytidine1409-2'-O)-methyltransferase
MTGGRRLDRELVARGLARNQQEAVGLTLAGRVFSGDRRLDKPGLRVEPGLPLRVRGWRRYVSRGGEKLEAALRCFAVSVEGRTALDCGASTGGFTDCLLQHGAARVYAVDVGHGQLHSRLRQDPRVVCMERTNLTDVSALPVPPSLATLDLSYLSLRVAVPATVRLLSAVDTTGPELLALVKPLFELRTTAITSRSQYRDVLSGLVTTTFTTTGWPVQGVMRSPLPGSGGTTEFWLYIAPGPERDLAPELERALSGL